MKNRLVDLLACPSCQHTPLDLTVLATETNPESDYLRRHRQQVRCAQFCALRNETLPAAEAPDCVACYRTEIMEGILRCGACRAEYPVIGGIPRFNPDASGDFPDFFARNGQHFRNPDFQKVAHFQSLHQETKRSFGYQWLRYSVTGRRDNEEHFYVRTNTKPGQLNGQLFFEAGCGMGRYIQVVGSNEGAEVVGLDLSLATNRAWAENRNNPFVHVVQGNILEMPFRPASFDHTYSIGVLHHTPNTYDAFRSMVRLVKPNGRVSLWVYHLWRSPEMSGFRGAHAWLKGKIADGLRVVTVRMPMGLLHYLCYLGVPIGWVQIQIRKQPPWVRAILSPLLLPAVSVHPEWRVRLLDTFDWYSPRYQWKHTPAEVSGWFRELGLTDIDTEGFEVTVRGRRPAEAEAHSSGVRNEAQPAASGGPSVP